MSDLRTRSTTRGINENIDLKKQNTLSDQFETITFVSITVDAIEPQAQLANGVFVTANIDLHSISSRPAALKAKLDTGAQGNILHLRLYRHGADGPAIIGLPTLLERNLVTLNYSVQ